MDKEPFNHELRRFGDMLQLLLSGNQLKVQSVLPDMCNISIKLKSVGSINSFPLKTITQACDVLVDLINSSKPNIERRICIKELNISILAAEIILHILTCPGINKNVYSEEIVDSVVSVFQHLFYFGRDSATHKNEDNVLQKAKLVTVLNLLTELVVFYSLPETTINTITSVGLYSLEYTYSNLSESAIKLLTKVFSKYENQQLSLLNDLQDYAKYSTKKFISINHHDAYENISSFSALLLCLLQNSALLPDNFCSNFHSNVLSPEKINNMKLAIMKKYKRTLQYASFIVTNLLNRCLNTNYSREYQDACHLILNDLLTVLRNPEWPAAVTLLTYAANRMVNALCNHDLNPSLQIFCLEWLCKIITKLRHCALEVPKNQETLNAIIFRLYETSPTSFNRKFQPHGEMTDKCRRHYLNSIFFKYLHSMNHEHDQSCVVENFYMTMWIAEFIKEYKCSETGNEKEKSRIINTAYDTDSENKENIPYIKKKHQFDKKRKHKRSISKSKEDSTVSYIKLLHSFKNVEFTFTRREIEIIINFFISKEELSVNFEVYLIHIVNRLKNSQPRVRAKIMQCLKTIINIDASLIKKPFIQFAMKCFIKDQSVVVRDMTADLIGQCLINTPKQCELYYYMLSERIMDKGCSVRKRVLKIFGDLISCHTEFPFVIEIHLKILERINDLALRPMVIDIFIRLWFTPIPNAVDKSALLANRVKNINKILNIFGENGVKCLHELLKEILDTKYSNAIKGCHQLIEFLINHILELEVNLALNEFSTSMKILYVIATIKPEFLVKYISVLEPYLSLHCQEDENIIICVAGILKHTTSLLKSPSETFLIQLESDLVKLLFVHRHNVVESCITCLCVVVKNVTHNFKLVLECFSKFFGCIKHFVQNFTSPSNEVAYPENYVQRSIFITGLILKNFEFSTSADGYILEATNFDEVFGTFINLTKVPKNAIKWYAIKALGALCCQYSKYMLHSNLQHLYNEIIYSTNEEVNIKCQVLSNLHDFFKQEYQEHTSEENAISTRDNTLHYLVDEDKNFCSRITILVQYLNLVIYSTIMRQDQLRSLALEIIDVVIQNGLMPPHKVIAHLMASTTDTNHSISLKAYHLLNEINVFHRGIIYAHLKMGINLSFQLQKLLQNNNIIHGYEDAASPIALLNHVYCFVQSNKQGRRHFIRILLQEEEESDGDPDKIIYLSDTLAYLPYKLQDEVLFIIHSLNFMAATLGYNFVESFQQLLLPKLNNKCEIKETKECGNFEDEDSNYDDDDVVEDLEDVLNRLPENTAPLQRNVSAFQNCLILLKVKMYLQKSYGIDGRKMLFYSPERQEVKNPICTQRNSSNVTNYISNEDLDTFTLLKTNKVVDKKILVSQYLEFKRLVLNESIDFKEARDKENNECVQDMPKKKRKVVSIEGQHYSKDQNICKRNLRFSKRRKSYEELESDYEP